MTFIIHLHCSWPILPSSYFLPHWLHCNQWSRKDTSWRETLLRWPMSCVLLFRHMKWTNPVGPTWCWRWVWGIHDPSDLIASTAAPHTHCKSLTSAGVTPRHRPLSQPVPTVLSHTLVRDGPDTPQLAKQTPHSCVNAGKGVFVVVIDALKCSCIFNYQGREN